MKKIILISVISAICTLAHSQSWNLAGNTGTNPAINFIGTTDNKNFKIATNNVTRIIVTNKGNVALGNFTPAFKLDVKGSINTDSVYRIGGNTVLSIKGTENTLVGTNSGSSITTGNSNTVTGFGALFSNTSGHNNIAYGNHALSSHTVGYGNVAIGDSVMFYNVAGNGATAVGYHAMLNMHPNTTPFTTKSVAVGYEALKGSYTPVNNIGNDNVAVGYQALFSISSGGANTAVGSSALHFNTSGNFNTAIGFGTLFNVTTGEYNTAVGGDALNLTTTGRVNTAIGVNALHWNSAGSGATAVGYNVMFNCNPATAPYNNYSVAVGSGALYGSYPPANNTGNYNTALGYQALYLISTGIANTATGMKALDSNNTGNHNTANGYYALFSNTSGSNNAAYGDSSLTKNKTGDQNCAFGRNAYFNNKALNNTTCIGYNSGGVVNAANRIELGNSSVSVIAGQVSFSTYSDARIKDNIKEDVPGLSFISKLRPVTYHLNIHRENEMVYKGTGKDEVQWDTKYDIEKIKMTGFLAQEVEKAALETGYDFSGVQKPANPEELYSLRYSDFVMPLVKAVQELDKNNAELKIQNAELLNRIEALEKRYGSENKIQEGQLNNSSATMEQNNPNPFSQSTVIKFYIPSSAKSAMILINDAQGRIMKQFSNLAAGFGTVTVEGGMLTAGRYNYTLVIDGNKMDTKEMILTK